MMTEGAGVERRLKATYLVSAAATFGMAYVAIAATQDSDWGPVVAQQATGGNRIEVVNEYIVVTSSASTTSTTPTTANPAPDPLYLAAPPTVTQDEIASATTQSVATVVPIPPTATPVPPTPPPPAESSEPTRPTEPAESPPSPPTAPEPTASSDTAPAERPPIPEGCVEPEFRRGEWDCDDD